jgi:hypothetical protein
MAMTDDDERVQCADHGQGRATYVCRHLAADPVQPWFGEPASAERPWPDAWCTACNAAFEAEGEWNERNESAIEISVLCHRCYEDARGRSVGRLTGDALDAWQAYVAESCTLLEATQSRLRADFDIDRHPRWDWSQETAELVFSTEGAPVVVADIRFVGSVSTVSHTWLWSWANPHLHDKVCDRMSEVRELGEARDFPHLATAKWPATEEDGWHMAAIAARVLGARGVYRTPGETGYTFLVILDARWVSPRDG